MIGLVLSQFWSLRKAARLIARAISHPGEGWLGRMSPDTLKADGAWPSISAGLQGFASELATFRDKLMEILTNLGSVSMSAPNTAIPGNPKDQRTRKHRKTRDIWGFTEGTVTTKFGPQSPKFISNLASFPRKVGEGHAMGRLN